MLHIINPCNDPYWNLALEEYFLKEAPVANDLVILWRNCPTVVIGRNQNIAAEINQPFIAANNIKVVRRLSGGGAVYHDLGNLNFTFITSSTANTNNFAIFTLPIVNTLAEFGIKAEFTGRNDLTIDGRKFSGNAQYIHRGRLLHHGTLLFDTDLFMLAQSLAGPDAKHLTPGVPSIHSRVTTIRQHLPHSTTFDQFTAALLKAIFALADKPYRQYALSATDRQSIEALAHSRYRNSGWNYEAIPYYNITHKKKFAGGTVQVFLDVQNRTIRQAAICGDFFVAGDISDLSATLRGIPFTREMVEKTLISWLAEHPMHNISSKELLTCFYPEPQS